MDSGLGEGPAFRNESPAPHTTETARLEAFSDGVFAIAITLLIIEVKVPTRSETLAAGGLLPALAHRWPSFLAYVISFGTIGIMWINHHAMFQYIRRADRALLLLHILFLMCIAFLPFPTALLSEYLAHPEASVAATALYGVALTVVALAFNAVWWCGVRDPSLLGPQVHQEGLRTISHRYRLGPLLYLAATGLAFLSVAVSLTVHALLALLFALPERAKRPTGPR